MKKRIVAMSLVLVLVLSLAATAFAAYYPTATIKSYSKKQYVHRGNKIYWTFALKSNSFSRIGSYYMAGYTIEAHYKKKTGSKAAYGTWYFTGKLNHTVNWSVPSYQSTGKYYLLYAAIYRYSTSSSTWYYNSVKNTTFYVY